MQFELYGSIIGSLNRRVIPSVKFHIVVLTVIELHLFVAIIATKGVNLPSEVHRRKECLFLWQVLTHLDCDAVVVQVIKLYALTSY